MADKSATFRSELSKAEVGLSEVRVGMPAMSALVAFARYDRTPNEGLPLSIDAAANTRPPALPRKPVTSYIAFVLRRDQAEPSLIALGSASVIDSLVAQWRAETTGAIRAPSPNEAVKSYRAAGAALRQRVWDPLRPYLTDVDTVFIVPDGTLNLVSFAALPVGQTSYLI